MQERTLIETYEGVDIFQSCGYYYPAVNGNVESKDIGEIKRWIKEVWLFAQQQMIDVNLKLYYGYNPN